MMKMKENKMTIESLATMVARGFDDMKASFKVEIKKELSKLQYHLEAKIDSISFAQTADRAGNNKRFDELDERTEELKLRLNRVEDKVVGV